MSKNNQSYEELAMELELMKNELRQVSLERDSLAEINKKQAGEMDALFSVAAFLHNQTFDLDKLIDTAIDKTLKAFKNSNDFCVGIFIDDKYYQSDNFKRTDVGLIYDIKTGRRFRGTIEAYYLKDDYETGEFIFLENEKNILVTIAEVIGRTMLRLETEAKLHDIQKFNDTIISNAHEGIIVYDKELRYRVWNNYMVNLTGLTELEVLGKKHSELIPYLKEKKLDDMLQKALSGEIVTSEETSYTIPQTNKKGWFQGYYSPQISNSGRIIGVIGTIRDITDMKLSREKLKKSSDQLREFASHLQSIREEERVNIAREIHDELGQVLTALKINLSLIESDVKQGYDEKGQARFIQELQDMQGVIDITIQKLRELITRLRPEVLDNLGLIDALEWHSREFVKQAGIICNFETNLKKIELDKNLEIAIFRIFQESLTNIARHSEASEVQVKLERNKKSLILSIQDDGKGITNKQIKAKKSFGLLGMMERAVIFNGEVKITGFKDLGTQVVVTMPILNEEQK